MTPEARHGGDAVAEVLVAHGVRHVFTLCGGHIAPILVSAKARGIEVVGVRDEATAAFAADAVSRLTGTPGVAAVTAGPGVTNTVTAVKNAQLAQSPLVLLGGATGTILEGRGSLQDIDQQALLAPHVKFLARVRRVRDLAPTVNEAFRAARDGVPGPAFVECPVDLLYDESTVRTIYGVGPDAPAPRDLGARLVRAFLRRHLDRLFAGAMDGGVPRPEPVEAPRVPKRPLEKVARALERAERPLLLVGSQAVLDARDVDHVASAVGDLGIPVYLSGMARGLLGAEHPKQRRHQRRKALADADLVILAGVAADFRLDYGRHVPRSATLVSANLSASDLVKNRRPQVALRTAPGAFLRDLAETMGTRSDANAWRDWHDRLSAMDARREADIAQRAVQATDDSRVNPLAFFRAMDLVLDDDSILVADGGDFVGTASYILRPRGPLRWLDPGVFGTLGVGGGFALGAKAARPESEVWLIWGDGSSAFSLAEIDTCLRHRLPIIAVIGNDASWAQIAREQVEILGDPCGTELASTAYHEVAEGYGGRGLVLDRIEDAAAVLTEAKRIAREGVPVVVNVMLAGTDFRKGSISM